MLLIGPVALAPAGHVLDPWSRRIRLSIAFLLHGSDMTLILLLVLYVTPAHQLFFGQLWFLLRFLKTDLLDGVRRSRVILLL